MKNSRMQATPVHTAAGRRAPILQSGTAAVLLAIFCNLLWGSAYPAIKAGYTLFQITDSLFMKLLFAGVRFLLAGILVLLAAGWKRRGIPRISRGNRVTVLLMALIYTALQYVFFYVGLSNTTGANGSIVNSTTTFMAVILAHFLYPDDRLNMRKVTGGLLGFGGVLLVTLGNGKAGFSFQGEGFILIAAACFVAGSAISKKAAQKDDSMTVTGYNLLIGGAVLLAAGLAGGARLTAVSLSGTLVLGYLALLSALAFTIWTMLLRNHALGRISVYNFIIPVSGALLSALFLHENIWQWQYGVSLILVCAGIIIVNRTSTQG